MNRLADLAIGLLWALTTALMCVGIWMVFMYAPEEKVMGAAQKIFYFHVPSAMLTYASVFVLLAASVAYLWTRNRVWDHVARGAAETGILFCTLVLITGPIWAKPAWGIWWTWEARLTTTLILWLLLVASLMVRDYAQNRDLGARLAAIVAIVAAVDVPIIHKAVTWWRGQHPVVFGAKAGESALAPEMMHTFVVCIFAFFLLGALLTLLRYRVASVEERTDTAMERLAAM